MLGADFVTRYQWEFAPTSGAYEIRKEDIKKGRSISLIRISHWWAQDNRFWRNRFNIDKITFQVVRSTAKLIESFRRGDIDICGLNKSANWYERVPDDAPVVQNGYIQKVVFYNDVPRNPVGIWLNTQKPLLNDQRIREGISHALNWDRVIEQFFRGDYRRLHTTADGYGKMSHPTLRPHAFSIEKALDKFAAAGFTVRGYDGILTNHRGQRLSFTVTAGFYMFGDLLSILKQEAVKAGLEIRIEILDFTACWKKVQEKHHELALTTFFENDSPHPRYEDIFHSQYAHKTQNNNITNLASPQIDRLIEHYQMAEDMPTMTHLAHRIEEAIHAEAVFVPGYMQPYYRYGFWRWVRFPKNFNVRRSKYPVEHFIHWINPTMKAETLRAEAEGSTFPPQILVFDQYKTD